MIRVSELKLPPDYSEETVFQLLSKRLRIPREGIDRFTFVKRSVDARDKSAVCFVATVDVVLVSEKEALKKIPQSAYTLPKEEVYISPKCRAKPPHPPVVVGLGPAGLFAAWTLASAGLCPVVLERGECVEQRRRTIDIFHAGGLLNEESNMQYGEGGAGAFSDGKLTTGIKDKRSRLVLETLVSYGAPEEILFLSRPHIGTDRLPEVVSSMRRDIERMGGKMLFGTRLTAIQVREGRCVSVQTESKNGKGEILCDHLLVAAGHSALDTQKALLAAGVHLEQKPFSIGARIEHPQSFINRAQYGSFSASPFLPPAEYHLSTHLKDGRGVYTFCMCPGGEVVNASDRQRSICVNGMSVYARDGKNANSAVLTDVRLTDLPGKDPLAGYDFIHQIENRAYQETGNDHAPCQRWEDFEKGRVSKSFGTLVIPTVRPSAQYGDLCAFLPFFAVQAMREGIRRFGQKLKGFDHPDALLTGPETRSSCPVRCPRDAGGQSNIQGIFPCGEGAGYAGGIMSAAVDGIRQAENVMKSLSE